MTPPDARTPMRRDPLLAAACVAGVACAGLALVPTATFAEAFAHPQRVARLGGAIPEATVRGAEFLRVALAAGAVAIPLLVWWLGRACRLHPNDAARGGPPWWPETRAASLELLGSIVVGAVLRIALASQGLWYDEISALLSFALEGPGVAFGSYAVPTNHVPMTLAVWASVACFGSIDELVVRLPAILAGVATIPAAFALGAALRDARLGNALALVAAVAPLAVLESAEARGYAFVILGATVAAAALARARRTGSCGDHAIFAIACAFAAWAHPVAILLPFAAGVVGLVRDRRLAVAALLAGVLAAMPLSPLLGDVLATRGDYARTAAGQPGVLSREGYETLTGLALSWSRWFRTPAPVLTALAPAGAAIVARARDEGARRARGVLAPFALAFVLALALPPLLGSWTYARFTLFALPIGLVAVAFALDAFPTRAWRAGVVALLLVDSLASLAFYRTKQPIREAVEVVSALRAPDDAVATIGLPDNAVGFYALQLGFEAAPTGFLGDALAATIARDEPRFVVVLYPDRLAPEVLAVLDRAFDRTHRLEGWADWGHGAVEIWERARR
ncbi:MAG: hypothetical protein RI967_1997 [Planctomycetota bacterium]